MPLKRLFPVITGRIAEFYSCLFRKRGKPSVIEFPRRSEPPPNLSHADALEKLSQAQMELLLLRYTNGQLQKRLEICEQHVKDLEQALQDLHLAYQAREDAHQKSQIENEQTIADLLKSEIVNRRLHRVET